MSNIYLIRLITIKRVPNGLTPLNKCLRIYTELFLFTDDDEEIHYIDLSQDYFLPSGELTNLGINIFVLLFTFP